VKYGASEISYNDVKEPNSWG